MYSRTPKCYCIGPSGKNETVHATTNLESGKNENPITEPSLSGGQVIDPMLLTVSMTKKLGVVNMEILGKNHGYNY